MDLLYYIDTYMTHALYPKTIIYQSIWDMSIDAQFPFYALVRDSTGVPESLEEVGFNVR